MLVSWEIDQRLIEYSRMRFVVTKSSSGLPMEDQSLYFYDRRQVDANTEMLERMIKRGMKPKWYVVCHFNDGGASKRLSNRRVDPQSVDDDLEFVKEQLFTELYGRKWRKKSNRAKSSWSIEYGKSKIKPHFNLVIEELPFPYDSYRSAHVLFNTVLPLRCKCLWRNSADIQPIDYDESFAVNRYCSKESNKTNSTINYQLTDF